VGVLCPEPFSVFWGMGDGVATESVEMVFPAESSLLSAGKNARNEIKAKKTTMNTQFLNLTIAL
jgi:hypothetical protein